MKLTITCAMLSLLVVVLPACGDKSTGTSTNGGATPVANFTVNATRVSVGQAVSFADASTDADNDITSWKWDFGDGSVPANTKNVTYNFPLAGSYLVTLTVTDRQNKTATSAQRVLVKNVAPPDYGLLGKGIREKITQLHPLTMVCAHRAMHETVPENSIAAIEAAITNKINIVEIDARLTLDKDVAIMHDATTGRTATANLTVSQSLMSELKNLKLLFNGVASTHVIPTLKECLQAAKGKVYVNIDASWDNSLAYYNKLYNEVAALNMVDMVFFYTESTAVAKALYEIDSDITVLVGAGNNTDWNNANNLNPKPRLWHLSSGTLNNTYTSTPFSEGIRFFANAYVNSTNSPPATGADAVAEQLISNKVSIIQTDFPVKIKSYLQAKNLWMQ